MRAEPDRSSEPQHPQLPQIWRIPVWQPAALILFATVMLALVLYTGLSLGPLLLALALAVASLAAAVVSLRYALVADEDGIWVRTILRAHLVQWEDVSEIDVTRANLNAMTIRISSADGTFVDVPTVLVQPTLPTNVRRSHAMVGDIARRLIAISNAHRS